MGVRIWRVRQAWRSNICIDRSHTDCSYIYNSQRRRWKCCHRCHIGEFSPRVTKDPIHFSISSRMTYCNTRADDRSHISFLVVNHQQLIRPAQRQRLQLLVSLGLSQPQARQLELWAERSRTLGIRPRLWASYRNCDLRFPVEWQTLRTFSTANWLHHTPSTSAIGATLSIQTDFAGLVSTPPPCRWFCSHNSPSASSDSHT